MKYIYKTKKIFKSIYKIDVNNGYLIKPKIDGFKINSVIIYDKNIINNYVYKKCMIRLLKFIKSLKDTDDSDDDVVNKINLFEDYILYEFNKYLTKEQIKKILKEVYVLKNSILLKSMVSSKTR